MRLQETYLIPSDNEGVLLRRFHLFSTYLDSHSRGVAWFTYFRSITVTLLWTFGLVNNHEPIELSRNEKEKRKKEAYLGKWHLNLLQITSFYVSNTYLSTDSFLVLVYIVLFWYQPSHCNHLNLVHIMKYSYQYNFRKTENLQRTESGW